MVTFDKVGNSIWLKRVIKVLLAFIFRLYNSMVLLEEAATQDINQVWKRFETILDVANGLINYAPVFRDYYYEALDSFRRDNVQYIEVRVLLPPVSDKNHVWIQRGTGVRTTTPLPLKITKI